jgi:NAD(P)-dependent dehydrogenase (short-subunit alcohol dehydrogenase family)
MRAIICLFIDAVSQVLSKTNPQIICFSSLLSVVTGATDGIGKAYVQEVSGSHLCSLPTTG